MSLFGKFLQAQTANRRPWLLAFLAALAALVVVNLFLRPEHAHFIYDAWPFFWPVFGLCIGLGMVLMMKKIVQPLITRKEDYYDDL